MSQKVAAKGKKDKKTEQHKDRAAEIANTFEWLITAFILAFVFRSFVMEAFRIPTGSMADTLKGAHFRLRCRQCGYAYDRGFRPGDYRMPEDTIPADNVEPPVTRCPSCGYYHQRPFRPKMPVANGDRILVLKCIYQFAEPKRWDVIVFKNPPEPSINYIKRLIGLPGEEVQIIDGDIYINGQIARKPPKVQNELWMPVYNNNYQPVRPRSQRLFNNQFWEQPFENVGDSKWITEDPENPTLLRLDPPEGQMNRIHTLVYNTSKGNDFSATYAYDPVDRYDMMPTCGDLMVRFSCIEDSPRSSVGIALGKYGTIYRAHVNLETGLLVVTEQQPGGEPGELESVPIGGKPANGPTPVMFANVDHRLIFEYGGTKWTHDMGRDPPDADRIANNIEPRVEIFGSGRLTLSDVAIFRDIQYTEREYGTNGNFGTATKRPFALGADEFFVLGDNSPDSLDCRWWEEPGVANKGMDDYRVGIVPRDYLVGKALFVYWPSGFKPFRQSPIAAIPNIGRMRFIYGGSNGNQ
jgi:signal peptidase I